MFLFFSQTHINKCSYCVKVIFLLVFSPKNMSNLIFVIESKEQNFFISLFPFFFFLFFFFDLFSKLKEKRKEKDETGFTCEKWRWRNLIFYFCPIYFRALSLSLSLSSLHAHTHTPTRTQHFQPLSHPHTTHMEIQRENTFSYSLFRTRFYSLPLSLSLSFIANVRGYLKWSFNGQKTLLLFSWDTLSLLEDRTKVNFKCLAFSSLHNDSNKIIFLEFSFF